MNDIIGNSNMYESVKKLVKVIEADGNKGNRAIELAKATALWEIEDTLELILKSMNELKEGLLDSMQDRQ